MHRVYTDCKNPNLKVKNALSCSNSGNPAKYPANIYKSSGTNNNDIITQKQEKISKHINVLTSKEEVK